MQKTKKCPYCQSLSQVVFRDCNPIKTQCFHCGRTFNAYPLDPDGYEIRLDVSEDEILSRAISHYGEPAQVLKCIEELAELIHELTTSIYSTHEVAGQSIQFISRASDTIADECRRFILPYNETLNKRQPDIGKIVSELADVSITTSQMLKIFNCLEEVEKIKQEKLSRLEERMGGDSQ